MTDIFSAVKEWQSARSACMSPTMTQEELARLAKAETALASADVDADLTRANAATAAAYEVAARAMGSYHWNRYASKDEGGTLSSPAVFTSHTHQHVEAIIRALATADQQSALDKLLAEAVGPYVALLKRWQGLGCPNCNGDCSHANPPIYSCIMQETSKALLAASKKGGT